MANEAQRECINTVKGQLIAIACPGAGKTTTLLARIRHMVKDVGIRPEHILMMTFTRAAAQEMKKRYESEPGSEKGVTFSTIHALCLSILTRFNGACSIFGESEERDYFYSVFRDCTSKRPVMDIPGGYRRQITGISDRDQFINDLILDICVHKNNPGREFPLNCTTDRKLFQFLWDGYEDLKQRQGRLDFDDLLTHTYSLLLQDAQALNTLRDKFRYIQVDEYQDTNYIQRDIIYLLAGENGNLAVVGDDDQSIYGFRGACPEIMLGFPKDYPEAKVIRMGTNYRSAKGIVEAAGRLIGRNKTRYAKDFIAAREEAGEIELTIGQEKKDAHNILAERIQKLLASGVSDTDIAVLYRTNREAEEVAAPLSRKGISFHVADGITDRYEHWIHRDILSYYRLANGLGDSRDLFFILNHPQRFLTGEKFFQYKDMTPDGKFLPSDANEKQMRLAAYAEDGEFWKAKNAAREVESFFRLLRGLSGKHPGDFLKALYPVYRGYLRDYAKFRGMDMEDLTSVWESYAADIQQIGESCTWMDWMDYIRRYRMGIQNARKSKDGVLLSSMHKSKGLEWKYVFIVNCVEGNVPYQKGERACNMEEERRLFYVACTRAKSHLELMAYRCKGAKRVNISPFIMQLDK